MFSATVCLVLTGPVVEHVVQLVQLAVEFVIGKEGVATDSAIVVSVCLIDKAFGWTLVSWLGRAAFVQFGTVVKASLARGFVQSGLVSVCLLDPLTHVVRL